MADHDQVSVLSRASAPERLPTQIAIPTLAEVGGLLAANDIELATQIRKVLRLLRPCKAIGVAKRRFGRRHDGGYIHLDDFNGIDTALSFGINDDVSWDLDAADRGLTVYQFDHTVEDPRPDDHRMVFAKKMIAARPAPGCATLSELVAEHDKGRAKPNIMLKMDIEGGEWPAIEDTPIPVFSRLSQITCEMHNFENIAELPWRQGFYRSFRRLALSLAPIHVHANNFASFNIIAGVPVPSVLEVTWVNRSVYDLVESDELFPTELDDPCHANAPDYYLGSFRF